MGAARSVLDLDECVPTRRSRPAWNRTKYSYDPNLERYKEVETTCSDYLGNTSSNCIKYLINPGLNDGIHFEKETNGSITSNRHFLYAAGSVIGVYTTRSDGSSATQYFHKDHLGSVVLTTSDNGTVVERLSYDAFGKRRNNLGTDDPNDLLRSVVSHQGFTGQEHLDDGGIALIDMSGRVYDPLIGRFLSADPLIQSPFDLQSLNRYSYVMNNPLSLVDPTGYFSLFSDIGDVFSDIGHAVGSAASWIGSNAKTIGIVTAVVVVSAATFFGADAALGAAGLTGLGAEVIAGAVAGAVAGGLSSKLLGGGFSWQAVAMGALSGAVTAGVGNLTANADFGIRFGVGTLAGGVTNWLQSAIAGHPSFISFRNGLYLGAVVSIASVGTNYLSGTGEEQDVEDSSDADSGSDSDDVDPTRVPASSQSGSDDYSDSITTTSAMSSQFPIDENGNIVLRATISAGYYAEMTAGAIIAAAGGLLMRTSNKKTKAIGAGMSLLGGLIALSGASNIHQVQ
jgi:RHS repeat-associated protein